MIGETMTEKIILDHILSAHPVPCTVERIKVPENALVHVFGTQEPVRDQPDERARSLLRAGWLTVESIKTALSEQERQGTVAAVQQAARTWLQNRPQDADAATVQQVRWLIEKTRSKESIQQIGQRVWLAVVLCALGCRGLMFEPEGHIRWDHGFTGRIGIGPDSQLDLAGEHHVQTFYTASFRAPDGTIMRGKGRNRWYIYRLTLSPAALALIERYSHTVDERIAMIVASETHATQPQLPRDFYGGDEFQQACIDAQDGQFDHILVLSPEHGVISLDDIVPSDIAWSEVLEHQLWMWQLLAMQRLSAILIGIQDLPEKAPEDPGISWWAWLNPGSTYAFTIFGGGFPVRLLFDYLQRAYSRATRQSPPIVVAEYRRGYTIGDFEADFDADFDFLDQDDVDAEAEDFELVMQDINQLLEWGTEFVSLVNIPIPPMGAVWELAPDEALIPMRILDDTGLDVDNLLDLLTDITLLIEQPLPFTVLINPGVFVSALLQITHALVHDERDTIPPILDALHEKALVQYIEKALQEPQLEDRLCACLSLAEQVQTIVLNVPSYARDQLLVWMQTFVSVRMREQLIGQNPH